MRRYAVANTDHDNAPTLDILTEVEIFNYVGVDKYEAIGEYLTVTKPTLVIGNQDYTVTGEEDEDLLYSISVHYENIVGLDNIISNLLTTQVNNFDGGYAGIWKEIK